MESRLRQAACRPRRRYSRLCLQRAEAKLRLTVFCSVYVGSRRGHLWRCLRFREQRGLLGAEAERVWPVWASSWLTPGTQKRTGGPRSNRGPRGPDAGYREEGREREQRCAESCDHRWTRTNSYNRRSFGSNSCPDDRTTNKN